MKKAARFLTSSLTLALLALTPVAVHAQSSDGVIDVGSGTTSSSTTSTTTAGIPNTGAAPENRFVQSSRIFALGSLVGAGIGLGIITLRKKRFNQ